MKVIWVKMSPSLGDGNTTARGKPGKAGASVYPCHQTMSFQLLDSSSLKASPGPAEELSVLESVRNLLQFLKFRACLFISSFAFT